jgi:hypothetical protein
MPAFLARRSISSVAFLIIASASANSLQAQRIAPLGAHAASIRAIARAPDVERQSTSFGDTTQAGAATGRSRKFHVVIGLVAGTAIGVKAGSVVASRNAERCGGGKDCGGPFHGVNEMLGGALIGAAVGVVVGAVWPVRK